jgi:hypothetical protein
MAYELRRLLPRQFADWPGTYCIDNDTEQVWGDRRGIDISSAGAGLDLIGAPDRAQEGHRGRRVGIQFADASGAERAYPASLTQLEARW